MKKFFFSFFLSLFFSSLLADVTLSSGTSFSSDQRWSAANKLIIDATLTTSSTSPGGVTSFPCNADQSLVVNNSYTYTIQNMFLKYLSPDHISLGTGSSIIFDSGAAIFFLKNETLNYTWKFGTSSALDGNNKTLTLGSSGILEVQAGGHLTLKDITLYEVLGTNLRCADNTGTITFDNVKIVNRNSWSFQNGAFAVKNTLAMTGGGKFVYQSAYASTINDNSTLFLTDGMTFSYDPAKGSGQAVAGQQNLVFTNTSSKLWCDGVTLKITNTGMRLTKGTLQFERASSVYVDAAITNTARALILGDGVSSNDPQINFGPDAKVALETGVIQYECRERVDLKFGDSVLLRHKSFGIYIERNPALNVGGFASTVYGSTTPSSNSYLYVGAGNSSQTWGSGLLETEVLTGSSYVKFVLAPPYVSISFFPYTTAGTVNVVSVPTPPYYAILAHAAYDSYDYNPIRIYKKSGFVGQKIFEGDEVYIMTYYGGFARYLGSSNLTYSGSFKEIFQYASATQPANLDSQLTWVVESINEKAYLSIPTNFSGTAPNVSGWPAASTYQF